MKNWWDKWIFEKHFDNHTIFLTKAKKTLQGGEATEHDPGVMDRGQGF
jgi:hypothetical protein